MRALLGIVGLLAVFAPFAGAGEKMPEGPPWVRDLAVAQVEGTRLGRPIFVYLTKTH